jgi:plastocyanin
MKTIYKNLFIASAMFLMAATTRATNHMIEVEDFEFNPSALNVMVGDTVTWFWHDGFHTTTSATVPPGAATWDHMISSTSPSFSYVVMVPGTYSYFCGPHQSMGMVGMFSATGGTTGIENATRPSLFQVNGNTIVQFLSVTFNLPSPGMTSLSVYDLTGNIVASFSSYLQAGTLNQSYDLGILPSGLYYVEVKSGNGREVSRIFIR